MRISDWSSDVCSSDLAARCGGAEIVADGGVVFVAVAGEHVARVVHGQDVLADGALENGVRHRQRIAVFDIDRAQGNVAESDAGEGEAVARDRGQAVIVRLLKGAVRQSKRIDRTSS